MRFLSCTDCGVDVRRIREIHYKIKSEIWLTVAKSSDILCIKCLEKRLRRELTPYDFTNDPVNRKSFSKAFKKSAALLNRLDKNLYAMKESRKNG
jgi:hypothetical protein